MTEAPTVRTGRTGTLHLPGNANSPGPTAMRLASTNTLIYGLAVGEVLQASTLAEARCSPGWRARAHRTAAECDGGPRHPPLGQATQGGGRDPLRRRRRPSGRDHIAGSHRRCGTGAGGTLVECQRAVPAN